MPAPHDGNKGFPDDRASDFVLGFPTAVAPEYRSRSGLVSRPPLFLLRVPEAGHAAGADRVMEALRASLYGNGKLVPLAYLPAGNDADLLAESAGVGLMTGAPEHMTPDRYPHFCLVRDLVTYVREQPRAWLAGPQTRNLRRHVSERRAQRGGLLGFTRMQGPQLGGLQGFLVDVGWLSFVQRLPKWLWARRMSRRVMRGWLGKETLANGGRNLFRVIDAAGAVWSSQLRNDPHHEDALQQLDRLLYRALLEDLRTPAPGRLLPARRRRTCRPVLLVEVPPPGAPGARAAERFLRSVHRARGTARPPGPLVVAVGRPSDALLADLGLSGDRGETFAQAALRLGRDDGKPALVTFGAEAMARPGLTLSKVAPRTFRFGRAVPTGIATCVTVLALLAAGLVVEEAVVPDHGCVGGGESVAASARATPVPVDSKGWFESAERQIDAQNRTAEQFAAHGRTVRTVVAFESNMPTDENETRFDGTIPELRGIAMWQGKVLQDAVSDDRAVPLRVDVRTTGRAFTDAVHAAQKLVDEVGHEPGPTSPQAYRRVVGVLGYAQSLTQTQEALQVLGAARIPTIGTTATADEMLSGAANLSYWPFTPANSTEARIEADFASGRNIVADPGSGHGAGDSCSPADRALVIESSPDLYSRSLADKFRADFPGPSQVFNFNQAGRFEPAPPSGATNVASADELARQLCKALTAQPDSVVYWSARARDFTAFVDALDTQGTCLSRDITVLGGNELTNVAQTGVFGDKDWLRLYYSAHRLPATDPRADDKTRQFVSAYKAFVERTTKGTDPWTQDGHSAVSYDAFHVLSQAVDEASLRDSSLSRESVLVALGSGVTFNGASGYVSYDQGNNAPPVDKTLVLLRQLGDDPKAVVACGAYRQGVTSRQEGAPCSR